MSSVLILATSPNTRGGITSVLKAHQQGEQWKKYHCRWITTHIDKSKLAKFAVFLRGIAEYSFYLQKADLVHIHVSEPNSAIRKLVFFRMAKRKKKQIVVHFHSFSPDTTINGPQANLYQELFCGADAVVVLSNYWKEVVDAKFHLGDKIRVLYNPCTVTNYPEQYEKTNSVLYAGALNQRKGYADLIKAFAPVAAKHSDWKIVFAGNGELEQARLLSEELDIAKQVKLLGWVSGKDKDRAYKEAKAFCLPSYAEGFPMAVLDAWAYGLPVITTPVGGIPDIAEDGKNLLLFNSGDIKILSECLERIISDEALRRNLAKESELLANTTFNIDTINNQLGELYAELLGKKDNI